MGIPAFALATGGIVEVGLLDGVLLMVVINISKLDCHPYGPDYAYKHHYDCKDNHQCRRDAYPIDRKHYDVEKPWKFIGNSFENPVPVVVPESYVDETQTIQEYDERKDYPP
jgi:hypothetical protein